MHHVIRRTTPQDVEAVAWLWRQDGTDRQTAASRAHKVLLRAQDEPTTQACWVVEGRMHPVIGWARACWHTESEHAPEARIPTGWYLMGQNVWAPMRRRGLARRLAHTRHDWLRKAGGERVYTFISEHNAASLNLHHQMGFVEQRRNVWSPSIQHLSDAFILLSLEL